MPNADKPRIALLLGDPSGIGPELVVKLLAEASNREQAHVVVVGDPAVWEMGLSAAGADLPYHVVQKLTADWRRSAAANGAEAVRSIPFLHALDLAANSEESDFAQGKASAAGGRYVLESSRAALELAQQGLVDGICFAPFNKQAMHLAGSPYEDDLRYFAHVLEHEEYVGELNVLGDLWTARVTSHVPLQEVAQHITAENIENAVMLAERSLRKAGIAHPRIAVAALNPHAGEGGLFGMEEINIIQPVMAQLNAKLEGSTLAGPYPSDTVFLKARDGEFDAVVTMYHDQGQVAMKLMGFSQGVTVHGGLPIVVTTPAHGTAFDIVGQGKANPGAITAAYRLACQMAVQ